VRLLGPCSFEATRITRHSFSLVYLNPPFDDEFGGGGRAETRFVGQAAELDTWELPFSLAPRRFQKTALTEEELERELARSPLHDALRQ